ncbi:MAG: replication restart helicase PriA [Fibrobacterota bacterium]
MIAAVAFPMAVVGLYDYRVPADLADAVEPGMPVKVPLRSRTIWGIVVLLKDKSRISGVRDIIEVRREGWNRSSRSLVDLYKWIAAYYHTPLGQVFKPVLKKGVTGVREKTRLTYTVQSVAPDVLTQKQREAWTVLTQCRGTLSRSRLQKEFGLTDYMISALEKKGVLRRSAEQILRGIQIKESAAEISEGELTREQRHAVSGILKEGAGKAHLLHGITGSGKTLVYQELAKEILQRGESVIILVPEISLTPQTVSRFSRALSADIALMHSRMSDGERRDSMEQMVSGQKRVIIGARSTILVPVLNPGLIIVDEEHEASYKQNSPRPRYNARDVAIMRGLFQNAVVVLGSATPSMESAYNSRNGKYHLWELRHRFGGARLPKVRVINMRKEVEERGNYHPVSEALAARIGQSLARQRQVILLLNRRGFSTVLICSACGKGRECPHCSVNLIYHRVGDLAKCHHCGYTDTPERSCPECGGKEILFKGTGIQKIEDHLVELFPHGRILRMDQDTTRRKGGHADIITAFERKEADILLGTQMVAKGLNFHGVDLVGVIQADIGLSLPDFRAGERLFQLLTQVAGRAGRSDSLGEVYIQTNAPQERAIRCAAAQDYHSFYAEEIEDRRALLYPPFGRIVRILVKAREEAAAAQLANGIAAFFNTAPRGVLRVLGPVPAGIAKVKGEYRYTLMLKSPFVKALHEQLNRLESGVTPVRGASFTVDVDPYLMG